MSRGGQIEREVVAALRAADQTLCADCRFMEGLRGYLAELVSWSAFLHLTGRGRPAGAIAEQVCDSAAMLRCAEEAAAGRSTESLSPVADIGSGAGFPGMIWKLARPDWEITLVERRQRTAAFLDRTIAALGIEGIAVIGRDARELEPDRYGIVVSKAAGHFSEILPIAERIGRRGSIYVTAKGDAWEEELERAPAGRFETALVRDLGAGRGVAIALRLGSP